MRVTITNFQSIENLTLEIVEGSFTCLVGQSNIGKSAIRRAIECVLYNNSDASYIRTGAKQCSVDILFQSGVLIKWMRDEKSASYEINGESFSKLSKTVPQPILDMGFRELEINKDKLNVQVASQFENIFLLNMTGGKVTDVFSNLGNLNKIINANKSCTSDLKNSKSRLNLRREDLITVKSKIKNYSGLDEQRNKFADIKESFQDIKKLKLKKEELQALSKKYFKSAFSLKAVAPAKLIDLEDPILDVSKFISLQKLLSKLEGLQGKVAPSANLDKVTEITLDLELGPLNTLKIINSKYNAAIEKNSSYAGLAGITEITLDGNHLYKIKPMKELLVKLEKSKVSLLEARNGATQADDQLNIYLAQEDEIHKEIKICPLCDKEFSNV